MQLSEKFKWGSECYIMGIVNATPDSFSGDGIVGAKDTVSKAVAQAGTFLNDGAHILDVGGESTKPGAAIVSPNEELDRVVPVITALSKEFPSAVISIDTYKASVAKAALDAGAHIINDVWGFKADPDMAPLAARYNVPVILMHNRSKPGHAEIDARLGGTYIAPNYDNFLDEVKDEMRDIANNAIKAGVEARQIILDPGVGFGKTVQQNMVLINKLDHFKSLGFPQLLGASRKSFIGKVLDVEADQRLEGTAATVALGVVRGANIVRVHDVKEMARIVRMTDAMLRAEG